MIGFLLSLLSYSEAYKNIRVSKKLLKNNILYIYIYITNSINKHKRNVVQLVRTLKFKHEGRGWNLPLSLPFFESHFGLFQKARRPGPPAR